MIQPTESSFLVRALAGELDKGEAEAIALAVERRASLLLVDERRARKVAERLGIRVVGVLGVLVEAKQKGFLPAVRPVLDDLLEGAGFGSAPTFIDAYLKSLVSRSKREHMRELQRWSVPV